jgi:peptidoglycan/xylan/chitin deacetylase (PgdA/CDA1 family)
MREPVGRAVDSAFMTNAAGEFRYARARDGRTGTAATHRLRWGGNGQHGCMPGACTFTFDDGPDPIWTPRVLAQLARCEIRATFFVVTELVRRAPDLVRAIAEAGHDVELHCDRHVRHTELSEIELEQDTAAALTTLGRLGVRPSRWRAPWGICTDATRSVAKRLGLAVTGWTVDTHDWRGDDAQTMLARAKPDLGAGCVVLMHDGLGPGATRSGCAETVALIELLTQAAREQRLQPGSLSNAQVAAG